MEIRFKVFDEKFLDKSFLWLNDKEVKRLTMSPNITKEEQKKWFDKLNKRNDYLIWGVTYDDMPVGVVGMKQINYQEKTAEYFGYIGEKNFWGYGIGKQMMEFIINNAKKSKLEKLYLYVSSENARAIALYEKYGFILCEKRNLDTLLMIKHLD